MSDDEEVVLRCVNDVPGCCSGNKSKGKWPCCIDCATEVLPEEDLPEEEPADDEFAAAVIRVQMHGRGYLNLDAEGRPIQNMTDLINMTKKKRALDCVRGFYFDELDDEAEQQPASSGDGRGKDYSHAYLLHMMAGLVAFVEKNNGRKPKVRVRKSELQLCRHDRGAVRALRGATISAPACAALLAAAASRLVAPQPALTCPCGGRDITVH